MLKTIPATAPQEEIFFQIETDGGVIVSDLITQDLADRLTADFKPHLGDITWGNSDSAEPDKFFGETTKRLHGLLSKSALMADIVTQPLLLAMANHCLGVGERCFDIRLNTCELMTIGPSESTQSLHRDADAWHYVPLPTPRPELLISANIALDDFTEDNGATVVVPGSHKWPKEQRAAPSQRTQAVMKRGSALLYSGDVLHGGGDNRTEATRTGLYVGYSASWLRPTENQLNSNNPEDIYALPPEIQKLYDVIPSGFSLIS